MSSTEGKFEETTAVRDRIREEKHNVWKSNRYNMLISKRPKLAEEEASMKDITLSKMKELAERLRKEKDKKILQQIQVSLTLEEKYIKEFLGVNGALYALVGSLTGHDADVQFEAACCITNLTLGSHKATFTVLKATAPYLITFLRGNNHLLMDQSAWALGNMAADCEICRRHLKFQGFLPAVIPLLKSPHPNVLMSAAFSLRCYTRYEPCSARDLLELGIVQILRDLVGKMDIDPGILTDIAFIIFHMSCSATDVQSYFIKERLIEKITELLMKHTSEGNVTVMTPLLRCLGNLGTDPSATTCVVSCPDFFHAVTMLMKSQYVHIRKELFWMLTNIICNEEMIEKLNLNTILLEIVEMLKSKEEVVMEVLYFLCTLLTFQPNLVHKVSELRIPEMVTSLTTSHQTVVSKMASTTLTLFHNCLLT